MPLEQHLNYQWFDEKELSTKVAIAIDNHPSSYAMVQASAAALPQFGIGVDYYGVVPTPALDYVATSSKTEERN